MLFNEKDPSRLTVRPDRGMGFPLVCYGHRAALFILLNTCASILALALLVDIIHLGNTKTIPNVIPQVWLKSVGHAAQYAGIIDEVIGARWRELGKLAFVTLFTNFVILFSAVSRLWEAVERRTKSTGLRSAIFHSLWSVATLAIYEYGDVALFSTWLLTITDSGLSELSAVPAKTHLWSLLLLSIGAVIWFCAGYAVGKISARWRSFVFPIITLLLLVQIGYDLRVEPDMVRRTSEPLPMGEVFAAVVAVAKTCRFPVSNIRFRRGLLGAGQTFGISQNIIVLSGPHLDALYPEEWAALAAHELGHWRYRDVVGRVIMRLSSRLLWAPIALWMMSDSAFFTSFGINTESLVVGFALSEFFAAQFDQLAFLIKKIAFRSMEFRADQFAIRIVRRDVYRDTILKIAWINRKPLTDSPLYRFFSDKNSPMSRISLL